MDLGVSELFTPLDSEAPETCPQTARTVPPRYPPAPPGTAGAGGDWEERRQTYTGLHSAFQACQRMLERLARAIELLETTPADSGGADYIRAEVRATRAGLAAVLREVYGRIERDSTSYGWTDLLRFKKETLRLMVAGQVRARLDRSLESDLFARVSAGEAVGTQSIAAHWYHYPPPPHVNIFRLGLLPAGEFARLVLRDFIRVCADPETMVSRHVLEREVTQRLLGLLYAAGLAWTGPAPEALLTAPRPRRSAPVEDPEERLLREWRRREAQSPDGA